MVTKQLNIVSDWLKLFLLFSVVASSACFIGWTTWAAPKVAVQIKKETDPLKKEIRNINYKSSKSLLLQEMNATPEQLQQVDRQLEILNLKPEK